MSFAKADSVSLSVESFRVIEVTPVAVRTTGRMIARTNIQIAIIENLRFVITRPSLPNEFTFPFDIIVTLLSVRYAILC